MAISGHPYIRGKMSIKNSELESYLRYNTLKSIQRQSVSNLHIRILEFN